MHHACVCLRNSIARVSVVCVCALGGGCSGVRRTSCYSWFVSCVRVFFFCVFSCTRVREIDRTCECVILQRVFVCGGVHSRWFIESPRRRRRRSCTPRPPLSVRDATGDGGCVLSAGAAVRCGMQRQPRQGRVLAARAGERAYLYLNNNIFFHIMYNIYVYCVLCAIYTSSDVPFFPWCSSSSPCVS